MDDLVNALNENSGAVVAVATTVYAILTLALLVEARSTRNLGREANVQARAKAYPPASFLLELDVRNFGPANAQNLVVTLYMTSADGSVTGEKRRLGATLLGPGEASRFLPTTPAGDSTLNSMAAEALTLHAEWSWDDDRRRLWFLPVRHRRAREWVTAELAHDFYDAWPLTERDSAEDLHEMAEKMRAIEGHQKALRRLIESIERRRNTT